MPSTEYQPPVSQLLTYGRPKNLNRTSWFDYVGTYDFTAEHIPSLIRLASDETLNWQDEKECYAPVHALRTLGQLKAETAIPSLISLLAHEEDDWFMEDLPNVFGMIGPACISTLTDYLTDSEKGCWSKISAAGGLAQVALSHPTHRQECVQALTQALTRHKQQEPELNGSLVSKLLDLNAVEAVDVIEKAYKEGPMDEMVCGSWAMVQIALGLATEEDFTPEELEFEQPEWMKSIQEMASALDREGTCVKAGGNSEASLSKGSFAPNQPKSLGPKSGFGAQSPKKKKKKR